MALGIFRQFFPQSLTFFNTEDKKKEAFRPLMPGRAGMYNCGPTVYDYAHIGNLRSYVFADTLRRVLEFNNYKVKQVINITDVGHLVTDGDDGEDKMTKALKREHKPITLAAMKEVALFYEEKFKEDLRALNIDTDRIVFPRASDNIAAQIALIGELDRKGYIYQTSDGLYFNTEKFSGYGRLGISNTAKEKDAGSSEHSRLAVNTEKKDPRDFAVWKFNPKLGWDTPWGKGFPGWHIECSAMAMANLGATIDIHTGGIDHIPVHHNNEIAQSEAATGKKYVHYWLHNEFIRSGSDKGEKNEKAAEKMAKSAGNFLRLKDLQNKGVSPLAYRYWLLGASYRTPMDFSWEALLSAASSYHKLLEQTVKIKKAATESHIETNEISFKHLEKFKGAVNDDLGTPAALAVLWQLIGDTSLLPQDKLATINEFDRVLGLDVSRHAEILDSQRSKELQEIPDDVLALANKREEARRAKEWKKADELRVKIEKKGYFVKDTVEGFDLTKI